MLLNIDYFEARMIKLESIETIAVILKPKECFYAWVADIDSALNQSQSVDMVKIAAGSTVLVIPHGESSTVFTLYIMKHLNSILKHEFLRWTPDETLWPQRFDYDLFMQYFDLEIHTTVLDYNPQSISNQSNYTQNFRQRVQDMKQKSVLILRPKSPVHTWIKHSYNHTVGAPGIEKMDFYFLERDATVVILPFYLDTLSKKTAFLKKNAKTLFEFELAQLITDKKLWPENRTFDLFSQWFGFEIYSNLLALQ